MAKGYNLIGIGIDELALDAAGIERDGHRLRLTRNCRARRICILAAHMLFVCSKRRLA